MVHAGLHPVSGIADSDDKPALRRPFRGRDRRLIAVSKLPDSSGVAELGLDVVAARRFGDVED